MLLAIIVNFAVIDGYRVDAVTGVLQIGNLMEVGGVAVDRLKMRAVLLDDADGVEP
jgi:hypothetical protein